MSNSSLKVVAVSDEALRPELLEVLSVDESDYKVIVVETIPHAYSRIRELVPDLVVVFMEIDDVDACRLLSMLELDHDLHNIPVVTCATKPERAVTNVLRVLAAEAVLSNRASLRW